MNDAETVDTEQAVESTNGDQLARSGSDRISSLVEGVKSVCQSVLDGQKNVTKLDDVTLQLDDYLEESYLLDPHIESILRPCLCVIEPWLQRQSKVKASTHTWDETDPIVSIYRIIYSLTKVRSYKVIAQFLPHAVHNLQPVLIYLESKKAVSAHLAWEVVYIMLLQLSIDVLIPFDLNSTGEDTLPRLEVLAKHHLASTGLERNAAACLLARIWVRRLQLGHRFTSFLQWVGEQLRLERTVTFLAVGALQTIALVLKLASSNLQQDDLCEIQNGVLAVCEHESLVDQILVKKYRAKISARLSCLIMNSDNIGEESNAVVEDTLHLLLSALRDQDTVVRFSAAKGLAKVVARLPVDYRPPVIGAVIDLFDENTLAPPSHPDSIPHRDLSGVSEHTWHGACLCIAEMARYRIMGASDFAELPRWIARALHLDIRRGSASSSDSVRDAACYVLWSFARHLSADLIRPHAEIYAQNLILAALLDKEGHVRRAAAAAFQENVGRHGLFPKGIQVITKVDFFSVGLLRNSLLVVTPEIAKMPEYRSVILSQIQNGITMHWDISLRHLGASALHRIFSTETSIDREEWRRLVEVKIETLQSLDSSQVHGALLVLAALCNVSSARDTSIPAAVLEHVQPRLLKNQGAMDIHIAICRFVEAKCMSNFDSPNEHDILYGQTLLAVERSERECQLAGAQALGRLTEYSSSNERMAAALTKAARSESPHAAGYLLSLGYVYCNQSHYWQSRSLEVLLEACDFRQKRPRTADVRNQALYALSHILGTCSLASGKSVIDEQLQALTSSGRKIEDALHASLEDYETDYRGDVGSLCRATGLLCIQKIYSSDDLISALTTENGLLKTLGMCLGQMLERLDRLRKIATETMTIVLRAQCKNDHQHPAVDALRRSFFEDSNLEGCLSEGTYGRIIPLMSSAVWRRYILASLVKTLGGKSEASLRDAVTGLSEFLEALPVSDGRHFSINQLLAEVLDLSRPYLSSSNEFTPYLKTIEVVLETNVVPELVQADPSMMQSLVRLVNSGLSKLKHIGRLQKTANLNCLLAANLDAGELFDMVMVSLEKLMNHPFPAIRSYTRDQVLSAFVMAGHETLSLEEALLKADWKDVDGLRGSVERVVAEVREARRM